MAFCKKHQNFINFLIVLVSGVFWKATRWEWQHPFLYFIYPVTTGAAWFFLFWGLARFLKRQFIQRQFKTFVISLLCLPVLLLPFTRWYETARFWLLKSQMEAVAVQCAEEYKEEIDQRGYVSVPLPLGKKHLSRTDGEVTYYTKNGEIQASFCCNISFFEPSWDIMCNTHLSSEFLNYFVWYIPYKTISLDDSWYFASNDRRYRPKFPID